ncbi:MAG: fibronectin type III domain-containing protein, partial [Candidatus Zixiibacteriota bacterium]
MTVFFLSPARAQQTATATSDTTVTAASRPLTPPTSVLAEDYKYDVGNKVRLHWVPSLDDQPGRRHITGYVIYRSDDKGPFRKIQEVLPGHLSYIDESVRRGVTYVYRVAAVNAADTALSVPTQAMRTHMEWIDFNKKYLFLIALIVGGAVIYYIETARRGKQLFVRRIAGLEA